MNKIPLTKTQKEIMFEFYKNEKVKVILNKKQRNSLWKKTITKNEDIDFKKINEICPALFHQITRSYKEGNNIQCAIFSECIYAQTLANLFKLNDFVNCYEKNDCISNEIRQLLISHQLSPRYIYSNEDKSKMLIQAGSCNGIDSLIINVTNSHIFEIEFKESASKTSEPDLPKYEEDGKIKITAEFQNNYFQFEKMLLEQKNLNFFLNIGNNVNDFSFDSIEYAVSNNYLNKKYADVICTEDSNGFLVFIPSNQASLWANIVGEIRPSGRNHYEVWTPLALEKFIKDIKGTIDEEKNVSIPKSKLTLRFQRGGNRKISGYKINSLFFVYLKDCLEKDDNIVFPFSKVRQLNPSISAKMFFKNIKYEDIKKYYLN